MKLSNLARASLVAMAIGLGAIASAPARGQEIPFDFSFRTPDGVGISMGSGGFSIQLPGNHGRNGFRRGHQRDQNQSRCLSPRGVAYFLEDVGYQDIEVAGQEQGVYYALAYRGYRSYAVAVDPCTPEILGARRFEEARYGY